MIRLPSRLYVFSIGDVLRGYHQVIASGEDSISIDASALRYIDPLGLCLLAAMVNQLTRRNVFVSITGMAPDIFDYLRRMDFLKQCRMDKGLSSAVRQDRAGSLVEVHCVGDRRVIDESAARLARTVVGRISDNVALSDVPDEMSGKSEVDRLEMPLRYVFNELLE